jgi:LEA14-like dessication related protein
MPLRVLLLILTVLAACASLPPTEPPRVSLSGLEPLDMSLFEQRYRLFLRIQNPNPTALAVRGMSFTLYVNDRELASGVSPDGAEIPAFDEAVVPVAVTSTLFRLYDQLRALESDPGQGLRYRLRGRLHLRGLPGGLAFDEEGRLDLSGAPPVPGRTI